MNGQFHAPAALTLGEPPPPQYPLDMRLGGPQSQPKQHVEMKILDPTGTWNPAPQSSSL
jgi:hypothetical protein